MIARLITWWSNVAASLWALPLAIAAACAGLALLALNLDLPWTSDIAWLYAGDASQAPEFASSLVSAMITLTALAFSITMIVLTLAAQQLGPRLIGNFMSDRGTQFALGLFIGTIVYLLLVLRALDGESGGSAPNLAITGGTALVLASVVALLFFVHWLAHSVVADHVVARLGHALDEAVDHAFSEEPNGPVAIAPTGGESLSLDERGYVQVINYEGLAKSMAKLNARILLHYRPGDHVLCGASDAIVVGASAEDARSALSQAVVISARRTAGQDPVWTVRQLVEIGLRALSPGINDEFTAMAVIDRLALSLSGLIRRFDPSGVWLDETGTPRVFGPASTTADMFDAAFDQLREASSGKEAILRRLTMNLCLLRDQAPDHHRPTAHRHLIQLRDAIGRAALTESSKRDLMQRIEAAEYS